MKIYTLTICILSFALSTSLFAALRETPNYWEYPAAQVVDWKQAYSLIYSLSDAERLIIEAESEYETFKTEYAQWADSHPLTINILGTIMQSTRSIPENFAMFLNILDLNMNMRDVLAISSCTAIIKLSKFYEELHKYNTISNRFHQLPSNCYMPYNALAHKLKNDPQFCNETLLLATQSNCPQIAKLAIHYKADISLLQQPNALDQFAWKCNPSTFGDLL